MLNKNKILNSYNNKDNKDNKNNKLLLSKIIDNHNRCYKSFQPVFSDFMPISTFMQFVIFLDSQNQNFLLDYLAFGGFDDAERVIIGFFPEHITPTTEIFPIKVLEVSYNNKYSKNLTHRDFLGSIIGLGVERTKIGDIINNNNNNCFLHTDIADYVFFNLERVGSTKVTTKLQDIKNNQDINNLSSSSLEEHKIITASLRLDTTLSSAFNISRTKVSSYIKSNKVFLNFIECDNPSKVIKQNDIITIRGMGRIKIGNIIGNTKKDRIILQVFKYK